MGVETRMQCQSLQIVRYSDRLVHACIVILIHRVTESSHKHARARCAFLGLVALKQAPENTSLDIVLMAWLLLDSLAQPVPLILHCA